MTLSWTLAIVTYNRATVLRRALRTALQQTRLPKQVVIVDASDDWQDSWQAIRDEGMDQVGGVEWVYQPAGRRGIAPQRTDALAKTTGDVVMLFDDDTLMYPDCAEQMMRVYESDTRQKIVGVQARRLSQPPDVEGAPPEAGQVPKTGGLRQRVVAWFGMDRYLLPYEDEPNVAIPDELADMNLTIHRSFRGAVMSYRTELIRKTGFPDMLERYCYLEDADASQRAARHGLLVEAYDARACHLEDGGGREGRFPVVVMGGTNAMMLHRLHAADHERSRKRYRGMLGRRAWYMLAKDIQARDWSFTGWRGTREARSVCDTIFDQDRDALIQWYADYQAKLWERT